MPSAGSRPSSDREVAASQLPSRVALAVAVCVMAAVTVAWRILTFAGFTNDYYIYIAGGQQMLLGEWPVRDFVDPGWPLMNSVSAAARYLFGRALLVEVLVVACALGIAAAFTVAAARRLSGSLVIALAVTLLEIAISPRSFSYPKLLVFAMAAWTIVSYATRPSSRRIVNLGVIAAVAFLFRHDQGVFVGLGALAVVLFGGWREGTRAMTLRAALLACTVILLLLPWALFVQFNAGLVEYLRPGIEFSRAEADSNLLRALPRFALPLAASRATSAVFLFYVFHALPILSLALAWQRARQRRERWVGESSAVAAIAVMAIPLNLGFLRDVLFARVPDAFVPAAVLGAWLIGVAWTSSIGKTRFVAVAASLVMLATTAVAVASVGDLRGELNRVGVINRRGAFRKRIADLEARLPKARPERDHIPSRKSLALIPFFDYLERCSSPGDRLLMTGASPDVYVMADRGFAAGIVWYRPGFASSPEDQARAIARMRAQSVPIVVFDLDEEATFRSGWASIAEHVEQHYAPLAEVPVPDTPGLRLLVERGRKAARVDSATGWPCFR